MKYILFLLLASPLHAKPLQVFILAGQSNMQGHAKVTTFEHIGMDPATKPMLDEMQNADGTPKVCERVWISSLGSAEEVKTGKLTAGFGASQNGPKIGPEFTFGLTMQKMTDAPILLIKTAWGGKSLNTDFRSPSAGPYVFNETQLATLQKQGKDIAAIKATKEKESGVFYRLMIEHVKSVLADIKSVVPTYDAAQGYELAGFAWFQGWNDMVDGHTYPDRGKPGRFAVYSDLLAHFIRDVRKDFGAPKMPFVIGVMGVGGLKAEKDTVAFREAMTAPALMPEFKGNVFAVPTAPFWSEELGAIDDKRAQIRQMGHYLNSKHKDHANADGHMTEAEKREYLKNYEAKLISPAEEALWKRGASNAGYHYLGCAKTFALMGKAFAEALIGPVKD